MKKLKSYVINFILVMVTFLIFFSILEFAFRRYHFFNAAISWTEPDSLIAWRYIPGAKYWYLKENKKPITGRINNFGWRDRDWTIEKPNNTVRIAIVGDSFVEAFQVEQDSTFINIAERILNKKSKNQFELMNFGRSGFTTTEELLIIDRDVLKFSPDMIVLFFFAENDIKDVSPMTCSDKMRPFFIPLKNGKLALDLSFNRSKLFKIKKTINIFKQNSALFSLLCKRINILINNKNIKKFKEQILLDSIGKNITFANLDNIWDSHSIATVHPNPIYVDAFKLNKLLLKKINEKCKQMNIKFLLFSINLLCYYPEREAKLLALDSTFNSNYFDENLSEYALQNNIDFIGLHKIFQEEYNKNKKLLNWVHWNYKGHQLVAKVLSDHISDIFLEEK